jgi:hypothetical protein
MSPDCEGRGTEGREGDVVPRRGALARGGASGAGGTLKIAASWGDRGMGGGGSAPVIDGRAADGTDA